VPAETPVTTPVPLTIAIAELLLPQVPPAVLSDRVVDAPAQIVVVPVITDAGLFTVTVVVLLVVPHELVTT